MVYVCVLIILDFIYKCQNKLNEKQKQKQKKQNTDHNYNYE